MDRLRRVPQRGELRFIGLRPTHGEPMVIVEHASALEGRGLDGDRAARLSRGGKRQVTLIQEEHLPVIASLLARPPIAPILLRRNLVVRGINLVSLKSLRFRIGDVELEGTGPCEPCSKMDDALGDGGFHAMRGHGGITARVLRGGVLRIGDAVWVDPTSQTSAAVRT
jgi:MOSC domain-containing protein YiiM